eukprot:75512-Rhodomonas_salina.1
MAVPEPQDTWGASFSEVCSYALATRCPVLTYAMPKPGGFGPEGQKNPWKVGSYARATRCPVLREPMVLPQVGDVTDETVDIVLVGSPIRRRPCYAMPGTAVA